MKDETKVTIWCVTYNHADYIEDAIIGFINQRCNFEFEIVIHDDCSTDGTIDILKEYEKRYPEKIKVIYEEKNLYSQGKRFQSQYFSRVRGKFVAFCEGDDFWVDNNKLQLQVDYMEKNPDCVLSGHNGVVWDLRTGKQTPIDGFDKEQDVSIEEILLYRKSCFPTASFLIRKELFVLPSPYIDCKIGDWMYLLYCVLNGKVHYFDRIMSVYRYYTKGSWTDRTYDDYVAYTIHNLDMVVFFVKFNEMTNYQYTDKIQKMITGFYNTAAAKLLDQDTINYEDYKNKIFIKLGNMEDSIWDDYIRVVEEYKNEKERIISFTNHNKRVYMMGTGVVADSWTKRLKEWGIEPEGYLVSDDQVIKGEFQGKKVLHLKDIRHSAQEVCVIIAIENRHKLDIEKNLSKIGINNYYWIKS